MKLSDLKQNLENLYRSDDMIFGYKNAGLIRLHWFDKHSLVLIGCEENLIQHKTYYNIKFLIKVLKECYNIIPDKYGRYS